MTHWQRVSTALAALGLLVACRSTVPSTPPTSKAPAMMSPDQARDRLHTLLDGTFEAIKPVVTYREGWPRVTENDQPAGTANVALERYVMTKVSTAKYGALLGLVERRWKSLGYVIESVNADPVMPAVFARASDGSALNLRVGYPGNITIGAVVNPVRATTSPFGPEPPQPTLPNGNPDILPSVDDPFWSH